MSVITPYHQLTVVVGLIEKDNKILIIRRHDPEHAQWHHRWEFPGGKIELHETPVDALRREIKEETGLTINSERLLGVSTKHWNTPKGIQQTFILLYHCHDCIGEVHLNDEENDDYRWEKPEAIIQRSDLLDGNVEMFRKFFLDASFQTDSIN
jgi:8-oxo-dGTP diphosphatase